jgi:carbamoyltransferase
MRILGISLGHDTNFCLLQDGKIIEVIEAERFFRQKRYKLHCLSLDEQPFPSGFQYTKLSDLKLFLKKIILKWGGEYDYIAVQNQKREEEFKNLKSLMSEFSYKDIINLNHHLCHAAGSFFTSPFKESVILSYDGAGNDGNTVIFKGKNSNIEYLNAYSLKFGSSYNNLGYICNISPDISGTGSGKTMGLTSYGQVINEWLPFFTKHILSYEKKPPQDGSEINPYGKCHTINWDHISEIDEIKPFINKDGTSSLCITDQIAQNICKTMQAAWTNCALRLLNQYSDISKNLCITGGCALNGIANYQIQQQNIFENQHFIPNPTDCGLSIGAALYVYHTKAEEDFYGNKEYFSPYLGEEAYDKNRLDELKNTYNNVSYNKEAVPAKLANLICNNKVIGVIKGRYEIGPRALGNRSILCNSQNKEMRDILNHKVKHREWYRPFAPVCTAEDSSKYFTNTNDIPYMSVICETRDQYKQELPSITHVDGTCRLQTVTEEQHEFLYKVLKEIEKQDNYPIVLNTSFNPAGEPIVNYYEVALEMLKATDLDYVLIEDTFFWFKNKNSLQ